MENDPEVCWAWIDFCGWRKMPRYLSLGLKYTFGWINLAKGNSRLIAMIFSEVRLTNLDHRIKGPSEISYVAR